LLSFARRNDVYKRIFPNFKRPRKQTSMSPIFEISNLKKSYEGNLALEGVSLVIEKGSMNFLLGANGSGKSTLMKCMAGHQHWDSGEILLRGLSRKRDKKDFNKGLFLISEDILPPLVSLGELKEIYQSIFGVWDEEVFKKFIAWGNLDLTKKLTSVSRGQKIQGLLALTLATRPEVLLIDEATAVLDPFIRSRFMMEIERLNKSFGMTVVIATNIGTEISVLQGRLLIMKLGKLVVDRPVDKMTEGFTKIRVRSEYLEQAIEAGFSFIEQNKDATFSFVGLSENLNRLSCEFLPDQRAITVDEIFIFFSDRKTS
jgi:ABC-2 type transport system ATP-binding protein